MFKWFQLRTATRRLHGTTPGKGRSGGGGGEDGGAGGAAAAQAEEEPFNPAAVLKTLPNATTAAYWLRRSAREEANGGVVCKSRSSVDPTALKGVSFQTVEPCDEKLVI